MVKQPCGRVCLHTQILHIIAPKAVNTDRGTKGGELLTPLTIWKGLPPKIAASISGANVYDNKDV